MLSGWLGLAAIVLAAVFLRLAAMASFRAISNGVSRLYVAIERKLRPPRDRSIRPEREAPWWAWVLVLPAYWLAMVLPMQVGQRVSSNHMELVCVLSAVAVSLGFVCLAILTKRWQRKPPTRTTAQVEEAPAELASWASSVLDKKLK